MTDLAPRGIFRPNTCAVCQGVFYSDTAWQDGRLVLLKAVCDDCRTQGELFGATP